MSTAPSQPPFDGARIIIAMGVSSSGKSATGAAIARQLHAPFLDGDQYHPAANKEKMSKGIPLVDEDRWPWLETLAGALRDAAKDKGVAVGACSPVAQRLPALEQALVGAPADRHLGERVRPAHLAPLSPIDDVRGSAGYRGEVALVLLRRLLSEVAA